MVEIFNEDIHPEDITDEIDQPQLEPKIFEQQTFTGTSVAFVLNALKVLGRHLGINNVPEPNNIDPEITDPQRRAFMKTAAIFVAAGILAPGELLAQDQTNNQQPEPDTPTSPKLDENQEHAEDEKLNPWLDLGTAAAVVANFARNVVWRGAYKGIDLGPQSAIEMNALAIARIAALKQFGNEEGNELAAEEIHEIIHGLQPLALLVLLSDVTTTELKVDPEQIFKATTEGLNSEANNVDYKNTLNRPNEEAELMDWQNYLEVVNTDLTKKVAQIAAVTTVLGPIGTTYSASALANNMKEDVLHILYEQSYAKELIKFKVAGDKLDLAKIQGNAIERSDKLFNGPAGITSLQLALAANINGAAGIGDPPEIYFAINHAASNPEIFTAAHGIGVVLSEFYTVLLSSGWLLTAGLNPLKAGGEFVSGQGKTLKALAESFAKSDLRSVSFGGGKKFVSQIRTALNDNNDPEGKLRSVLEKIPSAKLQLSPAQYARDKADVIRHNRFIPRLIAIQNEVLKDPEVFANSHLFDELFEAFTANNTDKTKTLLKSIEKAQQTNVAQELADIFKEIIESAEAPEESAENDNESVAPDPEMAAKVEEIQSAAQGVINKLQSFSEADQFDRFEKAMNLLGMGEQEGANIYKAMSSVDDKTVAQAIRILTDIEDNEDVIPGVDDDAHSGDTVEEHAGHHDEKHLLSHSAKEVLYALLTQIPSVPAIARLAKFVIPQLAFIEDPENITPSELKRIITIMLPVEAGMSGIADNVAAYLFAENVICSFFEKTFGPELFRKMSKLKAKIGTVAVKVAEIAGNLTKVGNGPNFSQEKINILVDASTPQGIALDRVKLPMANTLPHKNYYAAVANVLSVIGGTLYLHGLVDDVDEFMSQQEAA